MQRTTIKQKRERAAAIRTDLVRMSRDWSKYRASDYQPLETELRALNDEILAKRPVQS